MNRPRGVTRTERNALGKLAALLQPHRSERIRVDLDVLRIRAALSDAKDSDVEVGRRSQRGFRKGGA